MLTACLHIPRFIQLPHMLDFGQAFAWSHDKLLEDGALLDPYIDAQTASKLVLRQ